MSCRLALEADKLSKRFSIAPTLGLASDRPSEGARRLGPFEYQGVRELAAVNDLSIQVNEGDVYGFLGPNGAGKTTTIRMMLGLIKASSGRARIWGHDIKREFKPAIREVGALVEGPAFYQYMSGRRNLRLFGRFNKGVTEKRIQETLEMVGLGRRGDHAVSGYSQGMRQRLGIGLALLHQPRLLILDEPTNGLDPQGIREVRNLIRRIRDQQGVTVFLSSHLLGEMEMICDRIGIIYRGRIIKEGCLDDLLGSGADVIHIQNPPEQDDQLKDVLLRGFNLQTQLVRRGVHEFPRQNLEVPAVARALFEAGITVHAVYARRRSLEEYFVELTGDSKDVY